MNSNKDKKVRQPIVEGIFYPSDQAELSDLVKTYISEGSNGFSPLIYTPHAGYSTAGKLMGQAFSAASSKKVREVVIISPLHREQKEQIILPYFTSFSSPAGTIPVNLKSLHIFQGKDQTIVRDDIPHLEEHSIEVQLPFISILFPEASILPILLGKTTISMVKKLTAALNRTYGENSEDVLFVVTGNLSSYTKKTDTSLSAEKALNLFSRGDWREITEEARTGGIEACGAGALSSVLAFYREKMTMKILSVYEPDKSKTVAYGALAFQEEE